MMIEERKRLARMLGLDVNPRMRIFRIEDALLTDGEGRFFGRDSENGYLLQVNAHNSAKLSELMQVSDHLVAEFHNTEDHVSITSPKTHHINEITIFAILVE